MRPTLSRFIEQVARTIRRPISRFIGGTAALMPPGAPASRFFKNRQTSSSTQAATKVPTPPDGRFLPPTLSRFIHRVADIRQPMSRFMTRAAALLGPLPAFFASRFFTKPPTPPRRLRRDWPRKPDGPKR